jgi:hypothetical protein
MTTLNIVVIILFVLASAAVTTAFLAAINAGAMDWRGRMGPGNPYGKHFCWRLAVGYWGIILGILILSKAISSWEGIAVLVGGGFATYVYLKHRC